MSDKDVLLRSLYIKTSDGHLEIKYYGRRIVWYGSAPYFFFQTANWPWLFNRSEPTEYRPWWMPSVALVKEGSKALVLYNKSAYRGCAPGKR